MRALRLSCIVAVLLLGGAASAQSISALTDAAATARGTDAAETNAMSIAGGIPEAGIALPVPGLTLYPGDALNAAVLTQRILPVGIVERGGLAVHPDALSGKVARRMLPAGQPIPLSAVGAPVLVTKGVAARVQMHEGGLLISGYAMPLESGAVGSIIRLKNLDSGQVIVGEVQGDGIVRIKMR